jgi:hypothetical protein
MKMPNIEEYWWLYLIGFGLLIKFWRQVVLLAIVGFTIFVEIGVFSDHSTTFGTRIFAAIIVARSQAVCSAGSSRVGRAPLALEAVPPRRTRLGLTLGCRVVDAAVQKGSVAPVATNLRI